MGDLGKKLEKMFSAASFAEEGDFDAAEEMLAGKKKVLLVLTGRETDIKSLTYALNIAKRTQANLEALTTTDGNATREIVSLCEKEAARESVPLKLVRKSGCIKEAVIAHARHRRDIVCVVIESTDALNIECSREQRKLSGIWERLGCPLALVSEKAET